MNTKTKHGCRRLLAMLLVVISVMSLIAVPALAGQEDGYHDPAERWMNAMSRTNELDVNATVTHETFYCNVCRQQTSFTIWRTPEYTTDGQSAITRKVRYSDGTLSGGTGSGTILDGTPGVDATYTGYHWTKSCCETCGTMNSNMGPDDYSFDNNVFWLFDCAPAFTEYLDDVVTFEYVDSAHHKKLVDGGSYCEFCYGTEHTHSETLEPHDLHVEVLPQLGNQRFAIVKHCHDCEYTDYDFVAAKAVVASYFGVVDGQAHTLSVSDLSEAGVSSDILYGTSADVCTMSTPPSYTEEGQYTVYYQIEYTCQGVSMTENGAAYVWLRDESVPEPDPENSEPGTDCENGIHDFVLLDTVPPTCTEPGYERWFCIACGLVEKRNEVEATGHAWQSVVVREADCENTGIVLDICQNCGMVRETVTPKSDHDWKTYDVTATCTMPGYTVKECSRCGERHITDLTSVLGHDYQAVVTEPTCTEMGYSTWTCSRCGASYVDSYTAALGHDWDSGTKITDATCSGAGVTEYHCKRCEAAYLEAVSATGHTPGEPATCTEPQLCLTCGAVLEKAHGHSFTSEVTEPTCEKMGYTVYACANCGMSYRSDYTDALGHSYEAVVTAPTCTEMGFTTWTCSRCGKTYVGSYTEPTDHQWDEGTVIFAPSCTGDGMKEYVCLACGAKRNERLPATGHTPGEPATCTEPQLCEICGAIIEKAHGHKVKTAVTEPACLKMGWTSYACENCGLTWKSDYTDPLGHDYVSAVTAPTCTEMGYTTWTCSRCGDSYVTDHTDPLGHKWDEGRELISTTCSGAGLIDHRCVRCDYHYLEAVSPEGHTPGPEADCIHPQVCTVCGAMLVQAMGHSYEAVVTEPTCTEMGYTTYTCDRCGDSYRSEYINAVGHRESDWIIDREPTAEAEGQRHKECSVCGETLISETIERLYDLATTDSRGEAVVGGYLVIVTDTDTRNPVANATVILNGDGSISIRLPDGRLLDFADQTTVTVLLNRDKSPVQDLTVAVTDRNGNRSADKTDANGQITVPGASGVTGPDGNVTIGWIDADGNRYTITLQVTDYENGRPIPGADVTIGKTGNITVVLPDGIDIDSANRILLLLTDNYRTPLAGWTIIVKGDRDSETGVTDGDGILIVPGLIRQEKHAAYIVGYPDGAFGPERSMTRAEATAIFARLLADKRGEPIVLTEITRFEDVPADAWYSGYVRYLNDYGVINGTGEGRFSPDKPISRAEFVAMAVRFFEVYGDGDPEIMEQYAEFSDVSGGFWASAYIQDAATYGWIRGYGDGTFRAEQEITRAEVVTVVNRLLGRAADKTYINANLQRLNTFTDMTPQHWAYYDVMESANAHLAACADSETWSK